MAAFSSPFHGYFDLATSTAGNVTELVPGTVATPVTIKERAMSYQFYPHFHPYVAELIKRLIEGSVGGLQSADTVYVGTGDGVVEILANSTMVALTSDIVATGDSSEERVRAGTPIALTDDATLMLSPTEFATLTRKMVFTPSKGIQVEVGTEKRTLAFGSPVTLPTTTVVILPSGAQFALTAPMSATIAGCKPLPELYKEIFSSTSYNPSEMVKKPYPVKDLDFTSSGAYAAYNWELFFHVPLTLAIHLSKNQRFEEAQKWFHYIFDPTDDSDGPTPERFWKVKPFQFTDVKKIEEILVNLSTGADPVLRRDTISSIGAWKDAPFRPHVIARYRQSAYMFKTVMAYLDNLIDWGDSLFRQDTGESINEATQFYVLAANILGPRPQAVPKKGSVRPQTYASIKQDLNAAGNALVQFESDIAFDLTPHPNDATDVDGLITLRSVGNGLYFCVPRNDKLLSYWDTVADRLFKIHNSLNILGIFRQLPLFEPPIDPALLARAAAAGLDVSAVISGANQPLPLVRFQFLVQKAMEICQEVKSLGSNFLSAIEKEDNERLAIMRAQHERMILEMTEAVKYSQLQEAIKAREGLEKSFANTAQRYVYYERLLGRKESEINIPELDALDTDALKAMTLKATEPEVLPRHIAVDIVEDLSGEGGGKKLNKQEQEELGKLKAARGSHDTASFWDKRGAEAAVIPDFGAYVAPLGTGATSTYGGRNFTALAQAISTHYKSDADKLSYEAGRAAKVGSYDRREQEWAFQSNLAAGELTQLYKQLRAAQIREAIAAREVENHQQQIRNAEEIEHFLTDERTGKETNQAFYTWMKREVKALYGQCFQFAFDIARKAERALQHELGNSELSFLQFGYLAGKEGLLAGEKLYLDVKRMEMAYHDLNQREYELTRHVSLLQVNPLALLQLRATGRCPITIPEELLDLDCPGHYFRRIKSVAVSIPCVVGPYTSLNCTLTQLKSTIRKNALLDGGIYQRQDSDDRFSDHFGSLQAIVTSMGQNDSGLFETNLHDERYLPFEGLGVVSQWQLELPADPSKNDPRQFDYDTISDVIIHLRYTAREGGDLLRKGAVANLTSLIEAAQAAGSVRLFSIRHEFPTQWAKFKSMQIDSPNPVAELKLNLRAEHYPFWSQGRLTVVKQVEFYAKTSTPIDIEWVDRNTTVTLVKVPNLGELRAGKFPAEAFSQSPFGEFKFNFSNNSMEDLWMAITCGKGS